MVDRAKYLRQSMCISLSQLIIAGQSFACAFAVASRDDVYSVYHIKDDYRKMQRHNEEWTIFFFLISEAVSKFQ